MLKLYKAATSISLVMEAGQNYKIQVVISWNNPLTVSITNEIIHSELIFTEPFNSVGVASSIYFLLSRNLHSYLTLNTLSESKLSVLVLFLTCTLGRQMVTDNRK